MPDNAPDQAAIEIIHGRTNVLTLLAANPNYFGTLPGLGFGPVAEKQLDTTYERLTCASFSPERDRLEATVQLRQTSGYSGGLCTPGSFEHVRFYVSYDGGTSWTTRGWPASMSMTCLLGRAATGRRGPRCPTSAGSPMPRGGTGAPSRCCRWCARSSPGRSCQIRTVPTRSRSGATFATATSRSARGRSSSSTSWLSCRRAWWKQLPPHVLAEAPSPDPDPAPQAPVPLAELAILYRRAPGGAVPPHRFTLPHLEASASGPANAKAFVGPALEGRRS